MDNTERIRSEVILVMPSTKQIASRMFDFPDPLRPVMALNEVSQPVICVRTGYDLKPSNTSSSIRMADAEGKKVRLPQARGRARPKARVALVT